MSKHLPEEILLEIFYRLPVKSLGRCMCVSKAWNFLIKTPSFISTHLNNSYSTNKNELCLVTNDLHVDYSLHFDDHEFCKYTQLQSLPSHDFVIGSSNGLLCFVEFNYMDIKFIICNPIIRRSIRLPKPFCGCLPYKISVGFGFDSKRNDYKVLKVVKEDAIDECNQIEIYSLKRNSWKSLAPIKYDLHTDDSMVVVNGVAHWIACERVNDHGLSRSKFLLLGFDMSDEVLKEIMLPESLSNLRNRSHLYVIPYVELSSIAVIELASLYDECTIWVMKKYGVVETWTKMFSFGINASGPLPWVLGFRKNGDLILRSHGTPEVVWHYQESSEIDYIVIQAIQAHVFSYTESLVLLDQVIDVRSENGVNFLSNASNSIKEAADDLTELAADDSMMRKFVQAVNSLSK